MSARELPATGENLRSRLAADEGAQVIAFLLGEELLACDVMLVQEVVSRSRIHPLPDMPPRLLGVLRLRGELVPVVDVAPLLDLALQHAERRTVLVTEVEEGWLGVATDGVREVMHLSGSTYRPAPLTGRERDTFVVGVARVDGTLLTLIDLAEMLREQTTLDRDESS